MAVCCLPLVEYSAQLHGAAGFPYQSTNIDLLSLLKPIKALDPSFTTPLRYWKVIINSVSWHNIKVRHTGRYI